MEALSLDLRRRRKRALKKEAGRLAAAANRALRIKMGKSGAQAASRKSIKSGKDACQRKLWNQDVSKFQISCQTLSKFESSFYWFEFWNIGRWCNCESGVKIWHQEMDLYCANAERRLSYRRTHRQAVSRKMAQPPRSEHQKVTDQWRGGDHHIRRTQSVWEQVGRYRQAASRPVSIK